MTCRERVKGPRRHRCSWWHRDVVESYRLARQVWEEEEERVAIGYATERAEFRRDSPPPTFRQWLEQYRERAA